MYNYVQRRVKSSGSVPGEISSRPNKRWQEGKGKRSAQNNQGKSRSARLSYDVHSLISFIADTCVSFFFLFLFFSFFRGTRLGLAAGLVRTSCVYVCVYACVRAHASSYITKINVLPRLRYMRISCERERVREEERTVRALLRFY